MTAPLQTWQDVLAERGEEVLPGLAYDCTGCGVPEHAFALVQNAEGDWTCPDCRVVPPVDDFPDMTWDDVRGQRAVFLQRSDWSQLPDVPEATRLAWLPLRQRARDLTDAATVAEALELLEGLLSEALAL